MKSTKPRYIDATPEAMAKLAKMFKCTEKFIYMALTYVQNSEAARKIRFAAVEHFGATPMAHYPECETLHDTTEAGRKIMRQVFDNGTTLRVDKNTGEAWIVNRKGVQVEHRDRIDWPELSKLQVIAENL